MHCAIYARKSTDERDKDKQAKPLTRQEKRLCDAVVDVLVERHRGRKAKKGG